MSNITSHEDLERCSNKSKLFLQCVYKLSKTKAVKLHEHVPGVVFSNINSKK